MIGHHVRSSAVGLQLVHSVLVDTELRRTRLAFVQTAYGRPIGETVSSNILVVVGVHMITISLDSYHHFLYLILFSCVS